MMRTTEGLMNHGCGVAGVQDLADSHVDIR
jgi:hypothetical protein